MVPFLSPAPAGRGGYGAAGGAGDGRGKGTAGGGRIERNEPDRNRGVASELWLRLCCCYSSASFLSR